jgi:Dolichyl-phosphate-mannose-protein mannosyltransferase
MPVGPSWVSHGAFQAPIAPGLGALTFLSLTYSGALQTGVTANPDEAAHYVTALMIRSYLTEAPGTSPLQFAQEYYLHYPKVAFGVWPPMFHLALASWMFLTVASPASAVVLVAITSILLAYVMFRTMHARFGLALALTSAVWFVLLPTVQRTTASVLLDVACTLFMVSAAIVFGRYLDSPRWREAILFGILASAAVLTKNNAFALALLPPIAIAISRRWFIFTRWSLWGVPLLVCVICLPWYVFSWPLFTFVAEMAGEQWTAWWENIVLLAREPGLIFVPIALLGIWTTVGRGDGNGLWNSLLALLVSVWLFHSVIYPISSPRYMLPAYAGLLVFCAAGLQWLAVRLHPRIPRAQTIVAVVALSLFLATGFYIPKKPRRGFSEAADVMLTAGLRSNGTALVCSDTIGEGAFVSEVATRKLSPRTIVLRASKLLAASSWVGSNYAAKYHDADTLMKALDRARVEFVAMDDTEKTTHHQLLKRALGSSSDWSLVREVVPGDPTPAHSTVRLYRRQTPLAPGPPSFELDLMESLGVTLRR